MTGSLRFKFKVVFLFSLFLILAAAGTSCAQGTSSDQPGWPVHLRFLSGPNGGQWFFMGEPIAEVLSSRLLPTTSRIGGGIENIASVNHKTGDLAFTLNCFLGAAGSGEEEYKSIKLDNVSILANVYPQVLYVLLRKDFAVKNGIDSVEALMRSRAPVRFASLKPGTASEFILSLLLKYGYNTDFKKLEEQGWSISFNNYAEIADNLVAGELDCFAYTAGTNVPLIHTIEEHIEVVVLPLAREVLDVLAAKFRTSTYTISAGAYKSTASPTLTLGDYTCIIVRKDLPDDLVYECAKALWKDKKAVQDVIADFGALSPNTAVAEGLPMHPGALRFWDELLVTGGK